MVLGAPQARMKMCMLMCAGERKGRFILARRSPCTNMVRDTVEVQAHVASAARWRAREGISHCSVSLARGRGDQQWR